ncbi:hypothetical protein PAECIP111893_00308 [Paenibacillus plantiphilus]|uniref:Uncharacterized protein n=1 Tax=Paenibacillus plantiphilus TaxID=2905650 RepID=A0ABM9BMI2_9BACL|nr:hypothetical protein [Paenibacillus plantiphilus]CAH1190390.1 hypothetical protein PAECIP111893_00308 [Paenibacillus plantiphilus]
MFTIYDQYELLELFESEPIVIGEPEAGMNIFKKEDKYGFKLILTISIYEKECILSLTQRDCPNPIFDLRLTDVNKIYNENSTLYIMSGEKLISIGFHPNFSLSNL